MLYYSEDGNLSVKFTPPGDTVDEAPDKTPALRGTRQNGGAPKAAPDDWTQSRIDLVRTLSEASARARRRENASAYLRGVGLRSATVILDNGGRKSIWRVSDLDIDLDHRRSRSSIAGRARINSLTGPWEVNFRTTEAANTNTMQLALSVQGLVPRGLARSVPQLAVLEGLDMPVWAEAQLDVSSTGEVLSGTIGIDTAPGTIALPWLGGRPANVDGGHLSLSYNNAARRFDIAPSVLVWGDSRVQFTGQVVHTTQGAEGPRWVYDIKSAGGWLGAEPPIHQRITIDDWRARGSFSPERARIVLSQFALRAGGAEVSAQGEVSDMAGAMQTRFEGKLGTMSAETSSRSGRVCWRPNRASGSGSIWCAAACRAARSGLPPVAAWPAPIGARATRSGYRWRLKAPTWPSTCSTAGRRSICRAGSCAWRATPWRSLRPMRP